MVRRREPFRTWASTPAPGALRPAQLFEPGIADAEVVRDFVDDGLSNLGPHLILVVTMATDSCLVQRDPVRHDTAVTNRTSLGERDPLVESEEIPTWRGIINDDRKILDLGPKFVGQRLKSLFHQLLEAFIGYFEHQRSVTVSQPGSNLTNLGIGDPRTERMVPLPPPNAPTSINSCSRLAPIPAQHVSVRSPTLLRYGSGPNHHHKLRTRVRFASPAPPRRTKCVVLLQHDRGIREATETNVIVAQGITCGEPSTHSVPSSGRQGGGKYLPGEQ